MADQNGAYPVVTAQQIAAPDDQNRATGRFEVEGGMGVWIVWRRDHTIPLMTNLDSSLPVLPS